MLIRNTGWYMQPNSAIFLFFISVVFPIYLFSSFWAVELFTLIFGGSWARLVYFHDPYAVRHSILLSSWQTRVFEALGQQRILFKYQTIFESSGIFAGFGCPAKAMITTLLSLLPFHSSPVFPFL